MTNVKMYEYVDMRLKEMGMDLLNLKIDDDNINLSCKLLKKKPNISKEEFLLAMDIEEVVFDDSDHNLRIYKYTYCSECGQLVDRMDYRERKYCRYCENPSEETFEIIEEIYNKALFVMNYLLAINAPEDIIKLSIADRNLDKSCEIIKNNEGIALDNFIEMVGVK